MIEQNEFSKYLLDITGAFEVDEEISRISTQILQEPSQTLKAQKLHGFDHILLGHDTIFRHHRLRSYGPLIGVSQAIVAARDDQLDGPATIAASGPRYDVARHIDNARTFLSLAMWYQERDTSDLPKWEVSTRFNPDGKPYATQNTQFADDVTEDMSRLRIKVAQAESPLEVVLAMARTLRTSAEKIGYDPHPTPHKPF